MGAVVIAALDQLASPLDGPLYAPVAVAAGFPSPAQDYFSGRVDLNKYLVKNIACTSLVQVSGQAMEGAGISDRDEVLMDRSLTPMNGNIVVAVIEDEMIVRRIRLERGGVRLSADNPSFPDIVLHEMSELLIRGVVTVCLHQIAGFPARAVGYSTDHIDLNKHLIKDITCTFLVRVSGHSMEGAGISDRDEVIVDRSLTPVDGNVVVAVIEGEMTIKRLRFERGRVRLQADNPVYPEILIPEMSELSIWGVVTLCLHHV